MHFVGFKTLIITFVMNTLGLETQSLRLVPLYFHLIEDMMVLTLVLWRHGPGQLGIHLIGLKAPLVTMTLETVLSTLSRYLSTITRPQELQSSFPCWEASIGMEGDDEEREHGEYESSSNMSSGPEEPCHKPQAHNVTTANTSFLAVKKSFYNIQLHLTATLLILLASTEEKPGKVLIRNI